MPIKRSYADQGDGCATAHAMELLGDRWTYPVLRELMLGPKRFGELEDGLLGITPAVLTARLRTMSEAGLVERAELDGATSSAGYRISAWGRELLPVFNALGRWAMDSPVRVESGGLTPDGVVQSMLTMAPEIGPERPIELELRLFDARRTSARTYSYRLTWADTLDIAREAAPEARAVVTGDSTTWAEILHDGAPLDGVEVTGEVAEVRRLVATFAGVVAA